MGKRKGERRWKMGAMKGRRRNREDEEESEMEERRERERKAVKNGSD